MIRTKRVFRVFCLLITMGINGFVNGGVDADSLVQFWISLYDSTLCPAYWQPVPMYEKTLLAKARPDECFDGIGNPYPPGPPCDSGGILKINQAYIFGLTKIGSDLWFGTIANTPCMTGWAMGKANETPREPFNDPWRVCEYDDCQYSEDKGDWRPPKVYVYNLDEKTLIDKTPDDTLIDVTSGFRAAGCLNDILLLGGQAVEGITLFAFNTKTQEYIGSINYKEYFDIRSWIVVDNVLYTSFQHFSDGGKVLRWTGDEQDPFRFEVVGNLKSMGAFFAFHEGRIFTNSWPAAGGGAGLSIDMSALYMSPVVPPGGLTSAHQDEWKIVWTPYNYEPDPTNALTYFGGAMASFDGYLWWGTYHLAGAATLVFAKFYEPQDTLLTILGTFRAPSLFRGRHFDSDSSEIDLVYGLSKLPKFTLNNPLNFTGGGKWNIVDNRMGCDPLWGPSGFYNFYNKYTWTMAVYENQLFIGTFDWSSLYIERKTYPQPTDKWTLELFDISLPKYAPGGDLFRIPSSDSPAIPEDIGGLGNYFNYGIRTMLSDDALYLGMANPMNLLTDTTDQLPEGGWELIQLGSRASGVDDQSNHSSSNIPGSFSIMQNMPNPFNPETTIRFALKEAGEVQITVYSIQGRFIRKLLAEKMNSGSYNVTWDGRDNEGKDLPSGLYIYEMKFGPFSESRKMILLR